MKTFLLILVFCLTSFQFSSLLPSASALPSGSYSLRNVSHSRHSNLQTVVTPFQEIKHYIDSLFPALNGFASGWHSRCNDLTCLGVPKGFQLGGPQVGVPQVSRRYPEVEDESLLPTYQSAPPLPRPPPLPKALPLPPPPPPTRAPPLPSPPSYSRPPPALPKPLPLPKVQYQRAPAPQRPPELPKAIPLPRVPSIPRAPSYPSLPPKPLSLPKPLPLPKAIPLPRAQPYQRAHSPPKPLSLPRPLPLPQPAFSQNALSLSNVANSIKSDLQSLLNQFKEIQNNLRAITNNLATHLNIPNASNATVGSLLPGVNKLNEEQINECYNTALASRDSKHNIFPSTFYDAVTAYYKDFPENFDLGRFPEKAANLFKTMQDIAAHCVSGSKNFQLGLNKLSDWSPAEFAELMGAKKLNSSDLSKYSNRPRNLENGENLTIEETSNDSEELFRRKREATIPAEPICFPKDKSALPATYDWKGQGLVTDARFQGHCGSCWTFATIASLESAYRIKGKTGDAKFDLSEQQLLTCAKDDGKGDGCNGGTSIDAFNFILSNFGVTDEKTIGYDYEKNDKKCETKKKKRHAKIKDYCLRGTYVTVDGKPEVLTDQDIQSAIREFGAVYGTVFGENSNLQHYKSGVFDDSGCSKETNHAVTIVGWDESSWIVKNSWSTKWGEDGFFRIKRGENMCGINTYITFPIV